MKWEYIKTNINSFWGSVCFLTAFIAILLYSAILEFVVDPSMVTTAYSYGSQFLFIIITILFASLTKNGEEGNGLMVGFARLGLRKRIGVAQIAISLLLALLSIIAFLPVSNLFEYLFAKIGYSVEPNYPDFTSSVGALISGIVCLSILPAIGEELLLRGAFMRSQREMGTVYSLVVSSLIFALIHGSPTQFIYQLILGFITAYIVYISDSVYPSMIFHFTNNFTVVLFNYFALKNSFALTIPLWGQLLMFFLGASLVLVALYLFTLVTVKRNPAYSAIKENAVKEKGKKGIIYAVFDQSDLGYIKFSRKGDFMMVVLFVVVGMVWILNTIAGWMQ